MAVCKWCSKRGLFLSVNKQGLCQSCNHIIVAETQSKYKVIRESIAIAQKSGKLDTRVSRCNVIIDLAESLKQYEEAGITTIDPPPSQLIKQTMKAKRELVIEGTLADVGKKMDKAKLSTTVKTKINEATKALIDINDAINNIDDVPKEIINAEREIKIYIRNTQLESYITAAEKAEFKGQVKKAIDQYKEALYYTSTQDDMAEEEKNDISSRINDRLIKLGNE